MNLFEAVEIYKRETGNPEIDQKGNYSIEFVSWMASRMIEWIPIAERLPVIEETIDENGSKSVNCSLVYGKDYFDAGNDVQVWNNYYLTRYKFGNSNFGITYWASIPKDPPPITVIDKFDKEYLFLSNYYPCNIVYKGQKFTSTEAAFQCQKCANEEDKLAFSRFEPSESKMYGRKVKLRDDWEQVKIQEMENILRAKFTQIPALGEKLVETGNAMLIEGNTWRDTFWGVCEGKGENNLGKLLMKIREELKNENN